NRDRQETWPHTLSATSTHDTKRGEDTRARINVLSEIPEEWNRALHRWRELNRGRKSLLDGAEVPDANEEYLIYQTLVGTWPLEGVGEENRADYTRRLQEYMHKALKEAKLHTSWINPNEEYERAVSDFVAAILDSSAGGEFVRDFEEFQKLTTRAGLLNSLSQTLLKTTAPGVPDFYQGTELWAFTLVDPDNRRPVAYELRQQLLASMRDVGEGDVSEFCAGLLEQPEDGRVKLYVTSRALNFRREHAALFARGEYVPLRAEGRRGAGVVAFARALDGEACLTVASRFFTRLGVGREGALGLQREAWGDTVLRLEGVGGTRFRDVLTGREFDARDGVLQVSEILSPLPVALLAKA
ncbi:MAG: malto-oligosyltrehalose synthase, partial [Acidobacteria bacterium]|nr:malto-oligosyltrehalose synthase [Acidobacteriota bacterium]